MPNETAHFVEVLAHGMIPNPGCVAIGNGLAVLMKYLSLGPFLQLCLQLAEFRNGERF